MWATRSWASFRTRWVLKPLQPFRVRRKKFSIGGYGGWQPAVSAAMQMIIAYDGGPEQYVREAAHRRISRPKACPKCAAVARIRALCYYDRWVTCSDLRKLVSIKVRRFRCFSCRVTISMLPDFALTYRLVETDTVDRFLSGSRSGQGLDIWSAHLALYQRRLESRIPATLNALAETYGLLDLPRSVVPLWGELCQAFGDARRLAARLVADLGITVFGVYRCHRPHTAALHTPKISPKVRAPPIVPVRHETYSGSSTIP